ncbi:DUF4238 domain-containing protein [Asticcacaulis machinosus]|uniref:DUF4238 domain-containing protein n=1 Tax=Asticcacaulis machinosus TaxID=2984211 RepID=A0ABT5HH19_9CAUL|nr:DUF4238 domain-containing protein [Asticcacaulis machinosus]MDC7675554.1 DUF4238 domain-containing protein [Asticcacaulis machinosus]
MPFNKNQHFVPRCHLKPFSKDGDGLAINLFNLARRRVVIDAPVKSQCSSDYFYGKTPHLESAINTVENGYAKILPTLLHPNGPITGAQSLVLRRFMLLQYLRTEARAKAFAKNVLAMTNVPAFDIEVPAFREVLDECIQSAMLEFGDRMKIVDDLKVCLLRNQSKLEFVTSDNPAILANRWHQNDVRTRNRSLGVGRAGTKLMLPLSPQIYCVLYDGDVYSIANSGGWVDVEKSDDVRKLNEHQVLHCASNIYFRGSHTGEEIADLFERVGHRRLLEPMKIVHSVLRHQDDKGKRYDVVLKDEIKQGEEALVHVSTQHPIPSGWPSFLKRRIGGQVATNGTFAGYTRRWCVDEGFVTGDGYWLEKA